MGPRPLEDLEVPVPRSLCARPLVPGAPVGPRPLEDLEVPALCSTRARPLAPVAPLSPRPLEDLEVPVRGSLRARPLVPGAPVGPRPLEDREVPALGRVIAQVSLEPLPRRSFEDAQHHLGPRHARRRVRPARPPPAAEEPALGLLPRPTSTEEVTRRESSPDLSD